MILGVTGHRPQKMYGFKEGEPANVFVIEAIRDFLKEVEPDKVLTGMALGVDQWAAQWCIALGIPFVAILPVEHPEKAWPEKPQAKYHNIMKNASEVLVAPSNGESYGHLLQKRNEMIVDRADMMLGVYGGGPGGTRNCLEYALKQNKEVRIINPGDFYRHSPQSTE